MNLFKAMCSLSLVVLTILISTFLVTSNDTERSIQIVNECNHRLELFWVRVGTGELVKQIDGNALVGGATSSLNSFVGHTFQVNELPGLKSGQCKSAYQQCKIATFTVNKNQNQVIRIKEGLLIEIEDDSTRALEGAEEVMSECEEKTRSDVLLGGDVASVAFDKLLLCVKTVVSKRLKEASDEINYQEELREEMSDLWENYTCADDDLPTTTPIETTTWYNKGKTRKVDVMHKKKRSQIHVISDFVSDDECQAMLEAAAPKLHQATVADSSGGSQLSDSRKAMQAGISVPWEEEKNNNHIAVLSRRVYDYTNHVTGLNIKENGQENLMSIQYFGRGENDTAPDRYKPHCDGDCTGQPHKWGSRFATMVMYCEAPIKGGHTNFKNAGVHIKAEKGNGLFFVYRGDDGVMDKGFTTHSGCPVILGEKKLVTQWIRLGVDDQNRWSDFNTLGVKYADVD